MAERTGEYIEQIQERSGKKKGFWNSFLYIDDDRWGKNRREIIREQAHNELLQAGVDDRTILSCSRIEDLPLSIRPLVEDKLSKPEYLKNY
jgi:hypothetical protein